MLLNIKKGEIHFKKDYYKNNNVKQQNIEIVIKYNISVKILPEMNFKINRLNKIIFIYHIFKRVKKSKILTK